MAEATILLRDNNVIAAPAHGEVERKLTVWELLWNDGFVRKGVIILFLAAAWEIYGVLLDNPLLFPTFHDTIVTMWDKTKDGTIPLRAWASLKVLFMGYSAGIVLAAIFTILAISTRIGTDFLETITAMFNPLPAIARGMAMEPDILLMDEPFAALDALTRRTCQDELLQLWSETKFTVLFVTHSIAEAIKIGNRILLLSPHPGRVKAEVVDVDRVSSEDGSAARLEKQIHDLLFADAVTAH